ncbi:MAG TPA: tRNA preQ1(34) S-adenosylmethionine ribosyltransferase-isomerase QueA [Chloroflexota bacterium]|nr:tRNA preQ1(34) S-adenosylmethionine ribosyltransferase-isomerase QueA [Chloroflexota bacterium]
MRTSDFEYDLPPHLIAQTPLEPRDSARLLVVNRASGALDHRIFRDLPDILRPGDLLVANDSRVLPARLLGRRAQSGGAVEALLLHMVEPDEWIALVRPGRRVRPGEVLTFEGGLRAEVLEQLDGGERRLRLHAAEGTTLEAIHRAGRVPLPPYIHAPLSDPERYQTIYARAEGSVAAPTAGLHFTLDLLERLAARGIHLRRVTLHVGAGTFKPVQGDDIAAHRMHAEWATIDHATAHELRDARSKGRRIVAVGTTAVRVLETAALRGAIAPFSGWTDLFITPGFQFRAVDALITNFHLPRSTLLMLVSAFGGKPLIDQAYARAIASGYRFYSFGDAMLIE